MPSSSDSFQDRLAKLGLGPEAAAPKAKLFEQNTAHLADLRPSSSERLAFYVPGRIEFLGKHTDYGGGRSLLAAVERGFCTVASPRNDNIVRIRPGQGLPMAQFPLSPTLQAVAGEWSNYAITSAKRIAKNFGSSGPPLRGADIVFDSDLPPAAGMSSSSALLTLIFLVLSRINRLGDRPQYQNQIKSREDLGGYLGTVENGQNFGSLAGDKGVGTFGGSEDHTAMLCCTPRQFSQYSFCPVRLERRVDLPASWALAVASSGITAEKTGGAREGYNRISRVMSTLVAQLNAHYASRLPHLGALIDAHPSGESEMRGLLLKSSAGEFPGQILADRFDQFFQESTRIIPAVAQALSQGDVTALGPLVDRSQSLAQSALANQTPETIFLARSARELGAAAASAFGAGFGGSVWAIVPAPADGFVSDWKSRYAAAFPGPSQASTFFLTAPGPAAGEL